MEIVNEIDKIFLNYKWISILIVYIFMGLFVWFQVKRLDKNYKKRDKR